MEVFIGNIGNEATLGEVKAFFRGFSSKADFRMEERKLEDGQQVRFVIADFDSDRLAEKAIKKFAGQSFRTHPLIVREYIHRSYNNERRALNWRSKPWHGLDRRKDERRYKKLIEPSDDFDAILASSQKNEIPQTDDFDHLQIKAYDNLSRKN